MTLVEFKDADYDKPISINTKYIAFIEEDPNNKEVTIVYMAFQDEAKQAHVSVHGNYTQVKEILDKA